MTEIKPWYASRTIWASVVTVGLAAGSYLGLGVGQMDHGFLTDSLIELVTALAGILAILGRLRATTKIG